MTTIFCKCSYNVIYETYDNNKYLDYFNDTTIIDKKIVYLGFGIFNHCEICDPHTHFDNHEIKQLNDYIKNVILIRGHFTKDLSESEIDNYINELDYNLVYLLYYSAFEKKIKNFKYLLTIVENYDLKLLLSLILSTNFHETTDEMIKFLIDQDVDVNHDDLYIFYLLKNIYCGDNYQKLINFVRQNNIVLTDIFFTRITLDNITNLVNNIHYDLITQLYEGDNLDISEHNIYEISYDNIDLIKYFYDLGYKFNKNIIDNICNIICYKFYDDNYNEIFDDFDEIFPKWIVYLKYVYLKDYNHCTELLTCIGETEIDKICHHNIIFDDTNLKILMDYCITNNYVPKTSFLNDVIKSNIYCECDDLEIFFNTNFCDIIIGYCKYNNYQYVTQFIANMDMNIIISHVNDDKIFFKLATCIDNVTFIDEISNYLPSDYDFSEIFIGIIVNEKCQNNLFILMKKYGNNNYFNKIFKFCISDYAIYSNIVDIINFLVKQNEYQIQEYLILDILNKFFLVDRKFKSIKPYIMNILQTNIFTQSQLDNFLNASYRDIDICKLLLELGADIDNSNNEFDILYIDDINFRNTFSELIKNYNVDTRILNRLESCDKKLKNLVNHPDFKNNLIELLDISIEEYQIYVDAYKKIE